MTIIFTVPGPPVAKGRPRATVRRRGAQVWASTYTPQKTRVAEETFAARCMEHRPAEPIEGPILVALGFVFPVPKSWPKWKTDAAFGGAFHHVTKPDLDNIAKLCLDAMQGVFFRDDSQVLELRLEKCYGGIPRTMVTIEVLDQVTREKWAEYEKASVEGESK